MPVTPEQKRLVKTSWASVLPTAERAAARFYTRLFQIHPEVRPYFRGDMRAQGQKLIAMLDTVISGLDTLDQLGATLRAMGRAHAGYGVRNADYAKVADALLWTLADGLGDAFTHDVEAAWSAAYAAVADSMIEGAGPAKVNDPDAT